MNNENRVFEPIILAFESTLQELNAEIVAISENKDLSDLGKQKRIAEVTAKKATAFDKVEADLMAKVDSYKPEYNYKSLAMEDLSKISALLSIAKASDRAIDDGFLNTILRAYKEKYDLLEIAGALGKIDAYPTAFEKEVAYLNRVKVFEDFRAEISEMAQTKAEAAYSWNRLKMMTDYKGITF